MYMTYHAYSYLQFSRHMKEAMEAGRRSEAINDDLHLGFANVGRSGNRDRLRGTAFRHARYKVGARTETGPLPRIPNIENIIPEEDTLVSMDYGNETLNQFLRHEVLSVSIAINVELSDSFPKPDPKQSAALTEVLARVEWQIGLWIMDGKLDDSSQLSLRLILRG
ncbi:hypothetical protein F5Y11DRAFT_79259 [Daldinia sp. FL1419]|nr:hypothetical protein F5Y11DRAFT_79259 [Daldinia sp. FL1419]